MRRLTLHLGTVATVFFLGYGCYFLVDWLAVEHRSRTETFAPVDTVHLDIDGDGTVRVVGDGGDEIRVELRWREGLSPATAEARIDGGRLVVETDCPSGIGTFCTVGATIHVPTGTRVEGGGASTLEVLEVAGPVDVDIDNGRTHVEGARGPVQVDGDNGSVTVTDSIGPLVLRTDNGSVRTRRVEAETVSAASDNGSIDLDLATAPSSVNARTSNGSVTIRVPDDGDPYATVTSTDNGGVDNLLDRDPTAGRTVDARTSNGSITLRYR